MHAHQELTCLTARSLRAEFKFGNNVTCKVLSPATRLPSSLVINHGKNSRAAYVIVGSPKQTEVDRAS